MTPSVARAALYYFSRFELNESDAQGLTRVAEDKDLDLSVSIEIARCCADARFVPGCSSQLTALALRHIAATDDDRPGRGHLRALWLLVAFKHGNRHQRESALSDWQLFDDDQWRLHAIYVAIAENILTLAQAGSISLIANSDLQLTLRLCGGAKQGILVDTRRVLDSCVTMVNGAPSIAARHLPLTAIIMKSRRGRDVCEAWLKRVGARKGGQAIRDTAVLSHIARWRDALVS